MVIANRVLDRCASTNDLAKQLGEEGAPHGTWVSARVQDSGRGRLGRKWESVEGNLLLSMVVRVENKALWTWIPLASAVAVVRALTPLFSEPRLKIKWPNDLWLDGAKLAGILCEAVGNRSGSFIVIGLGLNCAHAPQGLDQQTTSLTAALTPQAVSADDVRPAVIEALSRAIAELDSQGVAGIVNDYERFAALTAGTLIEWSQSSQGGAALHSGVVQGLGPLGELLVSENAKAVSLFAEDVRVRASQKAGDGSLA